MLLVIATVVAAAAASAMVWDKGTTGTGTRRAHRSESTEIECTHSTHCHCACTDPSRAICAQIRVDVCADGLRPGGGRDPQDRDDGCQRTLGGGGSLRVRSVAVKKMASS